MPPILSPSVSIRKAVDSRVTGRCDPLKLSDLRAEFRKGTELELKSAEAPADALRSVRDSLIARGWPDGIQVRKLGSQLYIVALGEFSMQFEIPAPLYPFSSVYVLGNYLARHRGWPIETRIQILGRFVDLGGAETTRFRLTYGAREVVIQEGCAVPRFEL